MRTRADSKNDQEWGFQHPRRFRTRDLDRASRFYTSMFGWEWTEPDDTGYLVAILESKECPDKSVAGAMTMPPAVAAHPCPAHPSGATFMLLSQPHPH